VGELTHLAFVELLLEQCVGTKLPAKKTWLSVAFTINIWEFNHKNIGDSNHQTLGFDF